MVTETSTEFIETTDCYGNATRRQSVFNELPVKTGLGLFFFSSGVLAIAVKFIAGSLYPNEQLLSSPNHKRFQWWQSWLLWPKGCGIRSNGLV
jgi:hypothetical protein